MYSRVVRSSLVVMDVVWFCTARVYTIAVGVLPSLPCSHRRRRVPMLDIIYRYDAGPTLCCMVLLFVYVLLLGLLVVYGFRQVAVGLMLVRCLWRARRGSLVGILEDCGVVLL